MGTDATGLSRRFQQNVALRVGVYYAALVLALVLLERAFPGTIPRQSGFGGAVTFPPDLAGSGPAGGTSPVVAAIAMVGAVLLALPVAWVYVSTRAKRGYQQSVVQTLVILPMVVAGVVALVKHSLPLAFGLAAIVAAVRFRTALDDSKDAVHVFLATGIGLAAAVDLPVAVVISVLFNATMLVLWQTDFGRTPAALDGRLAERRLQRIAEQLNRTGTFVARVDDELFQDMSAGQLQAIADRAWRRARRHNPEAPDPEGRREALLRIHTGDVARVREVVEPLLDESLKRWRYGGVLHATDGDEVVEYIASFRRGTSPEEVVAALREADPSLVHTVELG